MGNQDFRVLCSEFLVRDALSPLVFRSEILSGTGATIFYTSLLRLGLLVKQILNTG